LQTLDIHEPLFQARKTLKLIFHGVHCLLGQFDPSLIRGRHRFCQNSNHTLAEKSRFCYADLSKIALNKERKPMNCSYCMATTIRKRAKKTELGYATFFCTQCRRTFNERTGSPFNYLEVPTDIVFLVVLWRLRYKLSLCDVAEMFLERGWSFTHETVIDWEARFAPLFADQLRAKRRGQAGRSWYVDETDRKVHGKWCYFYRAIDQDGNLVDSMLSEKRNMDAAQRFFKQAVAVVGQVPSQVTTDGHTSYPRAIREIMGSDVLHRMNTYLNNRLEQDHRGIKQRYYPMRGFGTIEGAARFCCAFDELRNYFRPRHTVGEVVSLREQRWAFLQRLAALQKAIQTAS
jgi:putative transposase